MIKITKYGDIPNAVQATGVGGWGMGLSSLTILLLVTYSFLYYYNWGKEMRLHSSELNCK